MFEVTYHFQGLVSDDLPQELQQQEQHVSEPQQQQQELEQPELEQPELEQQQFQQPELDLQELEARLSSQAELQRAQDVESLRSDVEEVFHQGHNFSSFQMQPPHL